MVSSNQHDVGTDSSSEHKELSLEERLEKVRRDAYAAGFAEGEVDGFIDGREQGFTAGYDESFAEGHAVGFAEGYDKGVADGHKEGYDKGLTKGWYEGFDAGKTDDYLRGYEDGLEAGIKDGFENGKGAGFEKGRYDGYGSGFDAAYPNGFAASSVEYQGVQKEWGDDGRKQELARHLVTARKLLESGMSIDEVEKLTSFNSQEMAKLLKMVRKHAKANEQAK